MQHREFALLRASGRSPAPRKRAQAFSTARCSVSGAGCATLHRDRRLGDRLRARRLVHAAGCAALLRNKFSKLARLLNETIVRNLFPCDWPPPAAASWRRSPLWGVKVGCAAPPAPLRQPRDMSVSGRVAGPPGLSCCGSEATIPLTSGCSTTSTNLSGNRSRGGPRGGARGGRRLRSRTRRCASPAGP